MESSTRPGLGIVELSELFAIEKSIISRAVQSICKKQFLQLKTQDLDARRKTIEVTTKGRAFIKRYDRLSNESLERGFHCLLADQKENLVRWFTCLNDALKAPPPAKSANDHAFRVEMRRMTHALRILKPNYLGSGLSMTEWQVLGELAHHPQVTTARQLISLLTIPQPVLSALLSDMEAVGFLSRSQHVSDKRSQRLTISKKGLRKILEIEERASPQLDAALDMIPVGIVDRGIDSLRDYIGLTPRGSVWDGKSELVKVATIEQKQGCRAFLLEQLVSQRRHFKIDAGTLLHDESLNYALIEDGTVKSVLELDPQFSIRHYVVACDYKIGSEGLLSAISRHHRYFTNLG